jgi:hypothetical protein
MDTGFEKVKRAAEDVASRLNEAVNEAVKVTGERLTEMQDLTRLNGQLRTLLREKEQCRQAMADLLIRMFDQNTFVEVLLRPEYTRIKELEVEIARLEKARDLVGPPAQAPTVAPNTPAGDDASPVEGLTPPDALPPTL